MTITKNYGTSSNNEIDPQILYRDTRPVIDRFCQWLFMPVPFVICMVLALVDLLVAPYSILYIFPVCSALIFFFSIADRNRCLPFKIPADVTVLDKHEFVDSRTKEPMPAAGIMFIGNQRHDIFGGKNEELWLSNSDTRMHSFVVGATGAGKTENLLSNVFNALCWGSGFIYIDGKADNSLVHKVFTMARRCGREDDVLVLNFMQGGEDAFERTKGVERMSNTMNPIARGSGDFICSLITSMMPEVSGDGAQWREKAVGMIEALVRVLVYMRFKGEIIIDPGTIRDHISLNKVVGLAQRSDLPDDVIKPIRSYLDNLPGFNMGQFIKSGKIGEETKRQHDYLSSQFTKLLGTMNDTYGSIFRHQLSEIDMVDVVLNNRILLVLIPALEKSKIESEGLGRLVVSSLRLMMAITLGSRIEGSYKDVVDSKLTNGPSPYIVIMDEAGNYFTEGTAKMFAQARSLGFALTLSGQDKQSMAKGLNKEEVESCIANTKIKQCMALEDPADTYDVFAKAAGEAIVSQSSSFIGNPGLFNANYMDSMNISWEKRSRLTVQELRDLNGGQSIILYKADLIRVNGFYLFGNLKINKKRELKLNQFTKIPAPTIDQLDRILTRRPRQAAGFDPDYVAQLLAGDKKIMFMKPPSTIGRAIQQACTEVMLKLDFCDVTDNEITPIHKGVLIYLRAKQIFHKTKPANMEKILPPLRKKIGTENNSETADDEIFDLKSQINLITAPKEQSLPFYGNPEVGVAPVDYSKHKPSVNSLFGGALSGLDLNQAKADAEALKINIDELPETGNDSDLAPYDPNMEKERFAQKFALTDETIEGVIEAEIALGSPDPEKNAAELQSVIAEAMKFSPQLPPDYFDAAGQEVQKLFEAIQKILAPDTQAALIPDWAEDEPEDVDDGPIMEPEMSDELKKIQSDSEQLKLSIEPVPQKSWFSNVRSIVMRKDWDKLRLETGETAGNKCEVCDGRGKQHPVECHEIWEYNDTEKIQKLRGFTALCPACHRVKHIGLATKKGRGQSSALTHLAKINGWGLEAAERYVDEQFAQWEERSNFEWEIDLTWLDKRGIKYKKV